MSQTVIHLVRHGEVDNPKGIIYGRLPGYHLSEAGRLMAKTTAAVFNDAPISAIVSSPLTRALETAEPFAAAHGLEVSVDERLIESENAFEGKPFSPRSVADLRNWILLRNPFRPSWGEPYEAIAGRMVAAINDLRRARPGQETLVISHQLPIYVVRRKAEHVHLWHNPNHRECSLASVTTFRFDGDRLASITYRDPARAVARTRR